MDRAAGGGGADHDGGLEDQVEDGVLALAIRPVDEKVLLGRVVPAHCRADPTVDLV